MFINKPDDRDQGFFGSIFHADIKNVKLSNVNIKGSYFVAGISVESAYSTITNCEASGQIEAIKK